MIVELCGMDLLRLTNGEPITIGDGLVVRTTKDDSSCVIGSIRPVMAARHPAGGNSSRNITNRRTGTMWISAKYANGCSSPGCPVRFDKGSRIAYDYDNKRAFCFGHGCKLLGHPDEQKEEVTTNP